MPRRAKREKFHPSKATRQNPEEEVVEPFRKQEKKEKIDKYWYIANGYLSDLIDLLQEFEGCSSWKFKDFAACWRKNSFSLIFRGRQTFKELLEFVEEVAFLTKRFLLRPHSSKRRIGALYCLYGLYFKHPIRQFFELRFSLEEYKETVALVQYFQKSCGNTDPAYVFRKLEICGAIKHCASSMEMCLEFNNKERELVDLEYGKERLAKSSAVNEALPAAELETDAQLMQYYHDMKLTLAGQSNTKKALCLTNPNLFGEVIDHLAQLKKEALDELGIAECHRNDLNLTGNRDDSNASGKRPFAHTGIATHINESLEHTDEELDHTQEKTADVVAVINGGRRATDSQTLEEELRIVADEENRKFMEDNNMLREFILPEVQAKKRKKSMLNLKDMKFSSYVDPLPNADLILPVPELPRETRARRRTIALRKSMKAKAPRVRKSLQYMPDCVNSIKEDDDFIGVPAVPGSATSLLINKAPTPTESSDMLQMLVKLNYDGEEVYRKLQVKVSLKQWEQMKDNPQRMEGFKEKIIPLLGISKNASDRVQIIDIEAVPAVNASYSQPKSPSHSSRTVVNSTYMKELRSSEPKDDDYDPFSSEDEIESKNIDIDEEYHFEKDIDSGDQLEDEEPVNEELSDQEDGNYFHSKYLRETGIKRYHSNREYYFERERVGVLNNDLIAAHNHGQSPSSVRMRKLDMGGRVKYVPVESPKPGSMVSNDVNDFQNPDIGPNAVYHSFNDYTTIDKPPPAVNRNSLHGLLKKKMNPYSIMCVRGKDNKNKVTNPKTKPKAVAKWRKILPPDSPAYPLSNCSSPGYCDDSDDENLFQLPEPDHSTVVPKLEAPNYSPSKYNAEVHSQSDIDLIVNDWNDDDEEMENLTKPVVGSEWTDVQSTAVTTESQSESTIYVPNQSLPSASNVVLPVSAVDNNNPQLLTIIDVSDSLLDAIAAMPNSGKVFQFVSHQPFASELSNPLRVVSSPANENRIDSFPVVENSTDPPSTPVENPLCHQSLENCFAVRNPNGDNYIPEQYPNVETGLQRSREEQLHFRENSVTPQPLLAQNLFKPAIPAVNNPVKCTPPPTSSQRKPTCGFFFSSKFKSLKRLSTALGEASGKPPTRERLVRFFKKGIIKK